MHTVLFYTSLHIALTYEVSEPIVHRTIRKIEDALMNSQGFVLPGKKALREAGDGMAGDCR